MDKVKKLAIETSLEACRQGAETLLEVTQNQALDLVTVLELSSLRIQVGRVKLTLSRDAALNTEGESDNG